MPTIDLKLKTYEQLQFEVNKLVVDNFLKQKELDQCKNNWEELKKYLIEESKFDEYKDITYRETMGYALDKMKELEEDK